MQTKLSAARKTVTRLQLKEENVQKYKREVNVASIERKSLEKQLNHGTWLWVTSDPELIDPKLNQIHEIIQVIYVS